MAALTAPRPLELDYHDCPKCETRQLVEWRRDRHLFRWVGVCRGQGCTYGRTFERGDEPMVRTDEQIHRGEVPDVPVFDRYIADTYPSLDYQPW